MIPPETDPLSEIAFVFPQTVVSFPANTDRKSTRLNSSHVSISYAVFCLKKKNEMALAGVHRGGGIADLFEGVGRWSSVCSGCEHGRAVLGSFRAELLFGARRMPADRLYE